MQCEHATRTHLELQKHMQWLIHHTSVCLKGTRQLQCKITQFYDCYRHRSLYKGNLKHAATTNVIYPNWNKCLRMFCTHVHTVQYMHTYLVCMVWVSSLQVREKDTVQSHSLHHNVEHEPLQHWVHLWCMYTTTHHTTTDHTYCTWAQTPHVCVCWDTSTHTQSVKYHKWNVYHNLITTLT